MTCHLLFALPDQFQHICRRMQAGTHAGAHAGTPVPVCVMMAVWFVTGRMGIWHSVCAKPVLCACREQELSCKPEQQRQQRCSATRDAVQHWDIPYPSIVESYSASLLHARYVHIRLEANCG